jgi:hypothetical protein
MNPLVWAAIWVPMDRAEADRSTLVRFMGFERLIDGFGAPVGKGGAAGAGFGGGPPTALARPVYENAPDGELERFAADATP